MIYVAAAPTPRLAAMLTGAALGPGLAPSMLIVPHQQLSGGRPRGMRGRMLATLDVSGCRGFRLGVTRSLQRTEPDTSAAAG